MARRIWSRWFRQWEFAGSGSRTLELFGPWLIVLVICLSSAGVAGAESDRRRAEAKEPSAWEQMLRDAEAEAEAGESLDMVGPRLRRILDRLAPNQARAFLAGEDPESIRLSGGGSLAHFLQEAASAGGDENTFVPLEPCILVNTRVSGGKFVADEIRTYTFRGESRDYSPLGGSATGCGIPGLMEDGVYRNEARALLLNVNVLNPEGSGRVKAWASDRPQPSFNFLAYEVMTPQLKFSSLNMTSMCVEEGPAPCAGGDLSVRAAGAAAHLKITVLGYLRPGPRGDVTAVTAGAGLEGGGESGDLELSIRESFRLPQLCELGEVAVWNGQGWSCEAVGDVTAVLAGPGLAGGGEHGEVTLRADFGELQARVEEGCPPGFGIRHVGIDGDVLCEPVGGGGDGHSLDSADGELVDVVFVDNYGDVDVKGNTYLYQDLFLLSGASGSPAIHMAGENLLELKVHDGVASSLRLRGHAGGIRRSGVSIDAERDGGGSLVLWDGQSPNGIPETYWEIHKGVEIHGSRGDSSAATTYGGGLILVRDGVHEEPVIRLAGQDFTDGVNVATVEVDGSVRVRARDGAGGAVVAELVVALDYLQVPAEPGPPPGHHCDEPRERGLIRLDPDTGTLYVCASAGWLAK